MDEDGRDDELYRRRLLEHVSDPHHWSPPAPPLRRVDLHYQEVNPLCGDDLRVALAVGPAGTVEDIRFEGHGCAISTAAASMASDHIAGKTPAEIIALDGSFVLALLGVEIPPLRMRCALLSLKVLKSAALGGRVGWEATE